MARSVVLRRSLALAGTGVLAGLGVLSVAAPAQAMTVPASASSVVLAAPVHAAAGFAADESGWVWCPYGYYWHHEGLLSGVLDNTGYLLQDLL